VACSARSEAGQAAQRCDVAGLIGRLYIQWTRKVDNKTVTRLLTDEQLRDYQPWFDNARTLKALTAELKALTLSIVHTDPRWDRK
jgi:hypothetical protein